MIIDMHVHSKYSHDSTAEPEEIIRKCLNLGIGGVCFTEHHSYLSSSLVEKLPDFGVKVFRGAEVATNKGHILIYGVEDDSWNMWDGIKGNFMDAQTLIDDVNYQGGACVLAHPFRKNHDFDELIKLKGLVAIESYNGKNSSTTRIVRNKKLIKKMGLNNIGGSDAHVVENVGSCYTVFEKEIVTISDLVNELKRGRYYGNSN
jgi:predicted metal-dependent phosphoesterase TrpH